MKKLVEKYPIIIFGIISILFLSIIGIANLQLFPSSFNYALMFPQWTPTLAAIIVFHTAINMSSLALFENLLSDIIQLCNCICHPCIICFKKDDR